MNGEVGPIGSAGSNDTLRANLARHGDDGSAVRLIEHFTYPDPSFDDSVSLARLSEVLVERGFDVQEREVEGVAWLSFAHRDPVVPGIFDEFTAEWAANLYQAGWIYDGWSCDVVHGEKGATA